MICFVGFRDFARSYCRSGLRHYRSRLRGRWYIFFAIVSCVPLLTCAFAIAVAVLMVISGYMASVSVVTTVKWFWFLFGIGMFVSVIYSLARTFRETVILRKEAEIIELYGKVAWLTIIIWCFYPIVWLFSEGFASFSVSFEVYFARECFAHKHIMMHDSFLYLLNRP